MLEKILDQFKMGNSFTLQEFSEQTGYRKEEILSCLSYLEQTGYIKKTKVPGTRGACSGSCSGCSGCKTESKITHSRKGKSAIDGTRFGTHADSTYTDSTCDSAGMKCQNGAAGEWMDCWELR